MLKISKRTWISIVFIGISSILIAAWLQNQAWIEDQNELSSKNAKKTRMVLYQGSEKTGIKSFDFATENPDELMSRLDPSKPLVIYIHGYKETRESESVKTMVSAYLEKGNDNIVFLDWSDLAFGNYLTIAARVKHISKELATGIKKLADSGLDTTKLHVIGHSLGAHIAGFLAGYLDFVIPRVTGLDPANPMFYQFGSEHIDSKSATQVDIVHTDGGAYGALSDTGSVDFYINGGFMPQPGCPTFGLPLTPDGLCSHWRSWRFFAESVLNEQAFPAVKCGSYVLFLMGYCKNNEITQFGYRLPQNASGSYYFNTNSEPPFAKGLAGIE